MVFMPPQHGKSELCSRYFPAWFLGTHPADRVILGSYESGNAKAWGRAARDVLTHWGPQLWNVRVSQATSAADEWMVTEHGGGMVTAGRGAGITGKPSSLTIIDDPIKGAKEAASTAVREEAWNWYRAEVYTRQSAEGRILVVNTRWHEDDLSGRLLRDMGEGGEKWEVLSLPALDATETQALCPELHSLEFLQAAKRTLGGYYWNALYQQQPQPATGTIFQREWFRYFQQEGESLVCITPDGARNRYPIANCCCFQTCDPAATEKESNDWFVLNTWLATSDQDLCLYDVHRVHAATTAHLGILRQKYDSFRPAFIGVENKTFGLNIIQSALSHGLPVIPCKADIDKTSRARTMAARYEAGAVYHRAGASWLSDYEQELVEFPRGEHDDQVDCAAYAGIMLAEGRTLSHGQQVVTYYSPVSISPF